MAAGGPTRTASMAEPGVCSNIHAGTGGSSVGSARPRATGREEFSSFMMRTPWAPAAWAFTALSANGQVPLRATKMTSWPGDGAVTEVPIVHWSMLLPSITMAAPCKSSKGTPITSFHSPWTRTKSVQRLDPTSMFAEIESCWPADTASAAEQQDPGTAPTGTRSSGSNALHGISSIERLPRMELSK